MYEIFRIFLSRISFRTGLYSSRKKLKKWNLLDGICFLGHGIKIIHQIHNNLSDISDILICNRLRIFRLTEDIQIWLQVREVISTIDSKLQTCWPLHTRAPSIACMLYDNRNHRETEEQIALGQLMKILRTIYFSLGQESGGLTASLTMTHVSFTRLLRSLTSLRKNMNGLWNIHSVMNFRENRMRIATTDFF